MMSNEKRKPKALEIRKGRVNGIPGTFMLPRVHKDLNAQVGLRYPTSGGRHFLQDLCKLVLVVTELHIHANDEAIGSDPAILSLLPRIHPTEKKKHRKIGSNWSKTLKAPPLSQAINFSFQI